MADDSKVKIEDELMEEESAPVKGKGRGWWGDPKAHAEAGRKGGRARSRKYNNTP